MPRMPEDLSGNVKFVDTVCNQANFTHHISDVDCHYHEMKRLVDLTDLNTHIVPYPVGKTLPPTTAPPPLMFRVPDYLDKLNHTNIVEVYDQYSVIYIHEAIASGHVFQPLYHIAPLNTNITFFKSTFDTKMPQDRTISTLENHTYSISPEELTRVNSTVLPTYFTWSDHVDITRPTDQGTCGNCWAIAASTCVSDVFVASKRIKNPSLSATYVTHCYPQKKCEGGNPYVALTDMIVHGARGSDCMLDNTSLQDCHCQKDGVTYYPTDINVICIPPDLSRYSKLDAELIQSYLNKLYGTNLTENLSMVPIQDIQTIIKNHIHTHGPVVGGFHVFKNFVKGDFRETNDIYMETSSYQGIPGMDYTDPETDWIGSHAVVMVGWGEADVKGKTVPYWVCRNSWGESWGVNRGYFRMAMYPFNTVSQFEYPSLMVSEQGHGITGGVIMVKAGEVRYPLSPALLSVKTRSSYTHNVIFFLMFSLGIVLLVLLRDGMSFPLFGFVLVVYLCLFVLYFATTTPF